ncbi:MAG: GNAT family N-acetyltransferase [Fimbriimonadaceae bacterium]
MIPTIILETQRTQIRQINESDFEEMMAVYADLELMRFVGDSSAITPEDARRWIIITQNNYAKKGYGLFLIEDKLNQICLGFVGLTHPGGQVLPEIKYVIKKPYSSRGLATEVVSALTNHSKEEWQINKIIATVDPENKPSMRILEKCGYVRQPDIINEDSSITALFQYQTKNG